MIVIYRLVTAALIALLAIGNPAIATQSNLVPPTTGVYTGVQFSNLLGDAFRSLASSNSGSSAAANVNGSATRGLWWLDTSVTPYVLKFYTGTAYVPVAAVDETNTLWAAPLGGGKGALTAASTTDLGSVPQAYVEITGTTPIASFGSSAPNYTTRIVKFLSATPLTYSAALPIPGGYDMTVGVGSVAVVTHLGSGNWQFASFNRASGIAIDISRVGDVRYTFATSAPANALFAYGQAISRATYPAYLAKVTRAQNGTRTSGNATIASVGDTSGMGAGMPVEGTGINAGCTIASVTAATIVLNSSSCTTSSGTATVTVFFTGYGSGGDATTVGVPDCQGYVMAGRDDLSGTPQSRITNAGSGVVGTQVNAAGGAQTFTLGTTNLPAHNHAVFLNDPGHFHTTSVDAEKSAGATANTSGSTWPFFGATNYDSDTKTTGITVRDTTGGGGTANQTASTGSGTAFNKLGPTKIANCVVYVAP